MWYVREMERGCKPLLQSLSEPLPERTQPFSKISSKKKRLLPSKQTGYWDCTDRRILLEGRNRVDLHKLPMCSQLPVVKQQAPTLPEPGIKSGTLPSLKAAACVPKYGGQKSVIAFGMGVAATSKLDSPARKVSQFTVLLFRC